MNKDSAAILDAIAGLIAEVDEDKAGIAPADLSGKVLTTDVGLDSLDVIKFVLLIEERFGLKIPDADIDSRDLLAVDKLVAYLAERL